MVELVDTYVLGAYGETRASSSLAPGTTLDPRSPALRARVSHLSADLSVSHAFVPSSAATFATARSSMSRSTIPYLRCMLSVLCPIKAIASVGASPARIIRSQA